MADEDDKKLAPDTPADTLDAHVENHIKLPDHKKFENEGLMNEVTAHPNLSAHSIEKMYHHMMQGSSEALANKGHAEPYSHEWAENLLKHPNAPANIKKDYALKTYHPENPAHDLHSELADQGVLSDDEIRDVADRVLADGEVPHTYNQLPPSYYLNHYKKAAQTDPENMSDEDKEALERAGKFGFEGLLASKKHTPETLDRLIDETEANKHYQGGHHSNWKSSLFESIIDKRPDLSKEHLNKIHQLVEPLASRDRNAYYSVKDVIGNILEHKNVDPILLAKYSTGDNAREEALSNPNLPKESMDAVIRKIKAPGTWEESRKVNALLENPSISKGQVKALIKKGSEAALQHHLADESDVRDAWNNSDKSTATAKTFLRAKNLPPDVLKDIVNHKNQDVAIDALKHPKADLDVVQEGLKRKAKAVQDAARLHPLVAQQEVSNGLKSGKTSLSKVYSDDDFEKHFDDMPEADQDAVFAKAHEKYAGTNLEDIAKKNKEHQDHALYSKYILATDGRVPEAMRDAHAKDLADMFEKHVPKNKAINISNGSIMSEDNDLPQKLLIANVISAREGNKAAENALLDNPSVLANLHSYLGSEGMKEVSPSFLDNMYHRAKDLESQNVTTYDRWGHPQPLHTDGLLRSILHSPNLSDNMFRKMTTNKSDMDKIGEGEYFNRFNDMPEDEQNARYGEILNSDSHEAAKSVIKAKSPPASFDRAMNMLTPAERNAVVNENVGHIKDHRPDVFRNAALGAYNEPAEGVRSVRDQAQLKALQNLDWENQGDRQTAMDAMSIPEGQPGHVEDKDLIDSLPTQLMFGDPAIVDHAFSLGRNQLAHNILGRKFDAESTVLRNPDYIRDEQDKAVNAERASALLSDMASKAKTMPTLDDFPVDNPEAANWSSLIDAGKNRYNDASLFKNLKASGANLDFLADFGGSNGEVLRKKALNANLLSKQKMDEIASKGSVSDLVSVGSRRSRQNMLDQIVSSGNMSDQDMDKLLSSMTSEYLNPAALENGRRKSMDDESYQIYQNRLNKLVDLYQARDPNKIPALISAAMRSSRNGHNLTKDDTSRISKAIISHISQKPYSTPHDKNMAMYGAYKGLSDSAPKKMLSQIEDSVFSSKDYETMVKMAEENNLSDSGLNRLAEVIKQPGMLNSEQIAGLSTQLDTESHPSTVVNMTKTFETKVAQEQAANPGADFTRQRSKMLNSLNRTFNPSASSTEEDKVKNDFIINYNKKAALDPNLAPLANTGLLSMSKTMASSDLSRAVDLFASLPDDRASFSNPNLVSSISDDMANDSRFIEACQGGWKLQLLSHNAESLTGANVSVLVNRALSEQGSVLNKVDLMHNLENNQFALPEDSVKIGRSLTNNEFNTYMRDSRENSLEGNILFIGKARMADLEAAAKDPNLVAPNAPFMGHEHRNHVLYNADSLASMIRRATMKEADTIANLGDKLTRISDMISAIHGHIKTAAESLRTQIQSSGGRYTGDEQMDHGYIMNIAEHIANTGLQLDRDDALKVFDMVKESNSVFKAANMDPPQEETYSVMKALVKRSENFDDQDWREVLSGSPHMVFALKERSEIPTSALNGIDYDQIENADLPDRDRNGRQSIQDIFTKSSADWFGKMSDEDQKVHGKKLMSLYVKMQSDGKIMPNSYSESMKAALKHMARHLENKDVQNLLQSTKNADIKQSLYKDAVQSGAGGLETLKSFVRDYDKIMGDELFRDATNITRGEEYNLASKFAPVTKSPYIDDELSGKVCDMFDQNPSVMMNSMADMLSNKSAPQSAIKRMASAVLENHRGDYSKFSESQSIKMAKLLMSHPNVPEKELLEMFQISNSEYPQYFAPEGQFNPALANPTHGGRLMRSMPIVVPKDVKHADESKMTRSVNLQSKDYKRMMDVMAMIPPEGISWVDFKRKFPKEEKNLPQSVKNVFMSAQNKPVMPEQFASAASKLDDAGKKYHLTYSKWASDLQRHRGKDQNPNLVIQINNSEESEKELSQDPKLWALYQQLLKKTNGISDDGKIGLHPTTPHLVSWSRVDTDQGGKAWVIEEYQSDFAQKFRKNVRALINNFPSGTSINGQPITAQEMSKYAKAIDKHLDDWSEASMQAVIDNAKANGISKLYMHGAELRGNMSNSHKYTREFWDNPNTKPQTVGFRKIYDENPRKFGFQECDYTDYPEYSQDTLNDLNKNKLSTKCWVMDLAPVPVPRRRKAK